MRIAVLSIGRYPKALARAGGDVRLWQNVLSLSQLGHEVHLIALNPDAEIEESVAALAASVMTIQPRMPSSGSLEWVSTKIFNPETLILRRPDTFGYRAEVQRALERIRPDLVWAEEQLTAVLVPRGVPLILSHVDFFFRLMRLRRRYRKLRRPNTMSNTSLERFEYELSRRARVTVVASSTDAQLFRKHGITASYIPVVGPTLPQPDRQRFSSGRFFLFGKANTSMRAARQHLRTVVWPELDRELQLDWHQVGDPPARTGDDPSWAWLTERFKVHGFVHDIAALFQFGDASVMPYPIDASGHAKYSVVMGYGMVNVGYEAGFRSQPELIHRQNCLAAATTKELVDCLREFRGNPTLRRQLAEASRATYDHHFSFEAQLRNFETVLATPG